jgi:D-lyxose ketol-isomerase
MCVSRYFFNINDNLDNEGLEFASLAEAKCEAVRFAGQMICDFASEFWDVGDLALTVTDANGLILFTMRFVGTEAPAIRKASAKL